MDIKEQLKELDRQVQDGDLTPVYYRPTEESYVCLLVKYEDGKVVKVFSRGIALCNSCDTFMKAKGRFIALSRALWAAEGNNSQKELLPKRVDAMFPGLAKVKFSESVPALSEKERKILSRE